MTKLVDAVGVEKEEKEEEGGARTWNTKMATPVQERTFVNWCNIVLRKKGFQIKCISDLDDGVCLLIILKHVAEKSFGGGVGGTVESPLERNWRIILKLLGEEDIHVTESPDTIRDVTRKAQILNFIVWRIILRFQICDDTMSNPNATRPLDYARAPIRLLRWIQHMIPNESVTNFTTDWNNGLALCRLVNSIIPGTIGEDMLVDKDNNEVNVRLACNSAEDELGIPEVIAPYEIANNMADEKCMMIYLSLFRSAHNATNKPQYTDDVMLIEEKDVIYNQSASVDELVGIPPQTPKVVAFGAGLRWGQVGKPSEFFVQVGGSEFADLSISIECRPFDRRTTHYKPCLQIKTVDKTSYLVRYTPTRPGEYVLNVFCSGVHIPNSPFRIQVHETVLKDHYINDEILISFNPAKVTFTESHLLDSIDSAGTEEKTKDLEFSINDSAFGDDDDLSSFADSKSWESPASKNDDSLIETSLDISGNDKRSRLTDTMKRGDKNIKIYGTGLKSGEVGLVSSFSVRTSNTEKGPLSVSITCPALSIPVPNVKTHLHDTYMMHEVFYLPTEPGIYQVDVNWGVKPLEGSPFYLTVVETRPVDKKTLHCTEDTSEIKEARISYYRSKDKNNLIIYHSATTGDTKERVNKDHLEWLLRQENPLDSLICITIDLEMERLGRKKIFDKASSKKLPMVFVNEQYVGSFDDIVDLYHQGKLKEALLRCKDMA